MFVASFRVHICLDSSVAFRLLAFRKNVLQFRYRSLKFDCQSHVRFCCCYRRYRRLADHVRLEAFTIKWAPAVAARVMILVWGRCYILEYLFVM